MTTLLRQSKSDTALLLAPGEAAVHVDLGPARTNLAIVGDTVVEDPSPRTCLAAPRSITVYCDLTNTTAGVLVEVAGDDIYRWRLRVSSGVVFAEQVGAAVATGVITGLSGTPSACLIHWQSRAEGTGVAHELWVRRLAGSTWWRGFGTAASVAPVLTDSITVGASRGGGNLVGVDILRGLHVGRRERTHIEAYHDWIGFVAPGVAPPRSVPAGWPIPADEGDYAGPVYQLAHAAARVFAAQHVALVNTALSGAVEGSGATNANLRRGVPSAPDWTCSLRYLWASRVPPSTKRARVFVRLEVYDDGAGEVVSALSVRLYSASRLPGAPAYADRHTASLTLPTAPSLDWYDLGEVEVLPSPGQTFLFLAWSLAPGAGEGDAYTTLWRFDAVTVLCA